MDLAKVKEKRTQLIYLSDSDEHLSIYLVHKADSPKLHSSVSCGISLLNNYCHSHHELDSQLTSLLRLHGRSLSPFIREAFRVEIGSKANIFQ